MISPNVQIAKVILGEKKDTTHRSKSKCMDNLDVRPESIRYIEKNIELSMTLKLETFLRMNSH